MGRHHEEAAAPVTGQYKLVWFEWSIPSVYASPETRLGHACVALTVLLQPQLRITRESLDSHLAFASTQARAEAGAGPVLGPVEGGAGGLQPAAEASAIDLGGNPRRQDQQHIATDAFQLDFTTIGHGRADVGIATDRIGGEFMDPPVAGGSRNQCSLLPRAAPGLRPL